MRQKIKISDLFIGIIFTLFFVSFSVIFVVNFRQLYYFDMRHLDIAQTSGYSEQIILENYNALIDYNSPFYKGELIFPSLASSAEGILHFKDVKDIFNALYMIFAFTLAIIIGIILYKKKQKDYHYLFVSAFVTLILPIFVSIGVWLNFNSFFIKFHKIFFRNDHWLFDPTTDPIINILPEAFFMHCATVIIILIILLSFLLFFIGNMIRLKKKLRSSYYNRS